MKSKFFTGMMIFLLSLICLTGMKAEAKSVGDISPDDISPEISDNRFQSAEGKVLPNFEVDMSISDQNNGKLSIDEDFELTSDGDIILIGTVQGQYIQGTPILNENGQLNKIPNRDQGIIMRVDRTTKKVEWARVVNYEDGNYNSQYAADKWFSSYKSITTNSSKSAFYVGGEVVNYYGDSGGGSTLIVKSIDANGNFQIAHKSYVSYGVPSRSDLTYAYFMDIQMEGNTLTMSASARYAAQGKQFIRYTLEPASLSITKNEFNPLDNTFWAKYQRTDVLKVDNKGLMAYNADVNGANQLKMSIRESENNYKEITLFDSVPEILANSSPYIFMEDRGDGNVFVVMSTPTTWYIALVNIASEQVVQTKKMAMNSSTTLNSVIYSEGKGLLLGGSTHAEESIFGSEPLDKNNGYYLALGNDLNVTDSQILRTNQHNSLTTIINGVGNKVDGFFSYDGLNNDGYIQNVEYPNTYDVNPKGAMIFAEFNLQPAPVLDTGNPILAFYQGERRVDFDELEGVKAYSGIDSSDVTKSITKNTFDLYTVGVQQQLYQIEYLPDSGNKTTGTRNVQLIHPLQTPKLEKSYADSHGAFQVGEAIPANSVHAFNGLDSANNVTYVVTAVEDGKITVDATIKRTEGTKTAVINKEITLATSTADETAVIDVTNVALAAGKYTSLTDVRNEGHFHIYAETMDNVSIDPKYVKLTEDPENLVDWNAPGVYYVTASLDPASGYTAKDVQVNVAVVDVGNPKVISVNMKPYNPTTALVVAEDDINGAGVYKINWAIKDANGLIIQQGVEESGATIRVQTPVPIDLSTLNDGNYTLSVSAADRIGHTSEASEKAFTVDRQAPVVTADDKITYEINTKKTEAEFLNDVNVKTEAGAVIKTNFDTMVRMDSPGDYTVLVEATDAAGNQSDPIYVIVTVEDTVAPIISADEAISYNQGNTRTEAQFLADIHATTDEPATITSDFADQVKFDTPGVYAVTLKANDISGNQAIPRTVNVTVKDVIAPVITADETVIYEKGITKSATDFLTDVHATTNDGSAITSNFATVVDLNTPGDYDVTLNSTDAGGNKSDPITVTVTVRDTTPPVITADTTITYEKGTTKTAAAFLTDVNATTNDGSAVTSNFNPNSLKQVGTYQVTLSSVDENGNYALPVKVTVIVQDTQKPVISSSATSITYERGEKKQETGFFLDLAIKTDDGTPVTSDFDTAVNLDTAGTYTVTLNAEDESGNKADPVTITVTVADTEKPIITADTTITYAKGTTKTAAQFLTDIHATTNDGSTITSNFDPTVLEQEGTYKVVLNAKDESDNEADPVTVTITVVDTKGPIINALNTITYERTINKNEADFLADIEATTDDGSTITTDFNSKDLDTVGTYTVTLNAEDASGNKATPVKVTMKVEDTIPPIITADQSITYERGITKTEQAFYTDIKAATSDNSPINSDFSKIDLTKTGNYEVLLQATDQSGNKALPLRINVLVQDTIAPVIKTTSREITAERGTPMTEQQLLAKIGANTDDGSKITTDYNPAIVNTSGDYLVHLYAVDAAGNQAIPVEITIHVKDTTAPIITADKKISYPVGTVKTVTEFLQDIHATTDDGSKIMTDFDPNMLKTPGTYTIHLNALDADGNKAKTIEVSLTVEEKVTPPTPPTPDNGGTNTNNDGNGANGVNNDITVNPTKQNNTATNESIPALGDTTSTIPVIVGMFLLATSLVLIRRK
ncbi:surface-anchored adhesin LapB [Listeria monocytogenes]|nr:cell surface protein [Listeria monocytogenes]EIU5787312.1 surface-anchored adhesin LapB [Listeria monocytogenes]EIV1529383.1 surface-anchored adhesin LapB [Listeria monocytogenes]